MTGLHRCRCACRWRAARRRGVDVLGLELLSGDVADARDDVELEVVAIRAVGRRAQLGLACRKPALDEVVAQGDPFGCPVIAVVDALDVFGEHLLGTLARVAGGVPTVAFFAGLPVEAFVDDGVVAVALAGDVSPHGSHLVTVGVGWCARGSRCARQLSATWSRPPQDVAPALAGHSSTQGGTARPHQASSGLPRHIRRQLEREQRRRP